MQVLDITNNKIVSLPMMLAALSNLNRLVLSSNLIVTLPGPLIASLAPTLKILIIDSNQLELLPDEIGALQRLEKLSLKSNRIAALNPCVGKCRALQFLTLSQV